MSKILHDSKTGAPIHDACLKYFETASAKKVVTLIFCTVVPIPAHPTQQTTVLVATVISEY